LALVLLVIAAASAAGVYAAYRNGSG